MASQYYHVVDCGRHMDGRSCAQYTKCVTYPHFLTYMVSCRPTLVLKDLTMVRVLSRCKNDSLNSRICKVVSSYDPISEGCITLKTHRGLANAIAVLAVDVVLLMAMLTGLLRSAHKSSTGIWYLLYQQVTPSLPLPLLQMLKTFSVHNLDILGGCCGDPTSGLSLLTSFNFLHFIVVSRFS
jgi:hypothetical protein